jgi:hypothetical protein
MDHGDKENETYDDIETKWKVLFDLFPLLIWVLSVQLNHDITGTDLLCDLGFDAFVSSDDDFCGPVDPEELCEYQAFASIIVSAVYYNVIPTYQWDLRR